MLSIPLEFSAFITVNFALFLRFATISLSEHEDVFDNLAHHRFGSALPTSKNGTRRHHWRFGE
jgi:hypothetical protein